MQFADFSNFVGFGSFVSIDLRVKVRNMISGRLVKAIFVSTSIRDQAALAGNHFNDGRMLDMLKSMLVSLAEKTKDGGFVPLSDCLISVYHDVITHEVANEDAGSTLMYGIGRLYELNSQAHGLISWDEVKAQKATTNASLNWENVPFAFWASNSDALK